ncbi:hypothetical protein EMIT0215P_50163 [Pseudomonas serboccidentalis]
MTGFVVRRSRYSLLRSIARCILVNFHDASPLMRGDPCSNVRGHHCIASADHWTSGGYKKTGALAGFSCELLKNIIFFENAGAFVSKGRNSNTFIS